MDVVTQTEDHAAERLSPRKLALLGHAEASRGEQYRDGKFNGPYREDDLKFTRFLIPPGKRVLELGCGRGDLLAALQPSYGVGIDFSPKTIAKARELHPDLHFVLGDAEDPAALGSMTGPFDYVLIADTIGMFEDIDGTLRRVHDLCDPATRIVISYYSHLWEPILKLAELLKFKSPQTQINYIATADFLNLIDLSDFEVIRHEQRQLIPIRLFGIGPFVNRFIAPLPGIGICACNLSGRRPVRPFPDRKLSVSILIPCRNERGNIENAIRRMPKFGSAQEILFVEGHSSDGTFEECERVRDAHRESWDITVLKQDDRGKGDAVRKGFAAAKHDVLMILDADLTMPPEALPKFHAIIELGLAALDNGMKFRQRFRRHGQVGIEDHQHIVLGRGKTLADGVAFAPVVLFQDRDVPASRCASRTRSHSSKVPSLEWPSTNRISWAEPNFGMRRIAFSILPRSLRQGIRMLTESLRSGNGRTGRPTR